MKQGKCEVNRVSKANKSNHSVLPAIYTTHPMPILSVVNLCLVWAVLKAGTSGFNLVLEAIHTAHFTKSKFQLGG